MLGGGIVPGSLVLLAGDPGIGKSTLLLQVADEVAGRDSIVFYVTGEESVSQVKMRADRLGVEGQGLYILTQTNVDEILARLDEQRPALVVIDSIQTMYDPGALIPARQCFADSGMCTAAVGVGQGEECASYPYRPCYQGRRHCGTKGSRAYG